MSQRKSDADRAIEMAKYAAKELVVALRKADTSNARRRMLALRWARAIHRHLATLLDAEASGPDEWGALTDEERQFVFAEDPPRDSLMARASDLIRRTSVDDAERVVAELERRVR